MSASTIRIAGVQMDPILGDRRGNLAKMAETFREATSNGAKLVVFPECALTGYAFTSKAEAMEFAEPIPGPSVDRFAQMCAETGAFAAFGMLEKDGDRLFNACALVGPDGLVGSYRKVHLPYLGVDRFADPGDRPFAVQEFLGLRVGMHICYDGAFPEVGRVLSLLGADLLILPTNWPIHSVRAAEVMMACRALENVVYAIAVNRVGEERGFRFAGRSSICDPGGEVLAFAGAESEEILYADVDPAIARRKKLIRIPGQYEIDRIGDRRPAFYEPIVEPNGRD